MAKASNNIANSNYKKNNTKQLAIRFYPTDMAILDYIKSQDNFAQYIKGLVIADMRSKGIEPEFNEARNPHWREQQ